MPHRWTFSWKEIGGGGASPAPLYVDETLAVPGESASNIASHSACIAIYKDTEKCVVLLWWFDLTIDNHLLINGE